MRERKIQLSVFSSNRFILFCVIFTVNIMAEVGLSIFSGKAYYFGVYHVLNPFVICSAPIMTFLIFDHVPALKYFLNDDCKLWIYVLVHYLISSGVLMLSVFVLGLFVPMHADAYRNAIISYTQGFIIVILCAIIIDFRKIAVANKNLRKIQARKLDGGISNEEDMAHEK